LLATSPAFAHVSSSFVREIELAGGDASIFVPKPVALALQARRGSKTSTEKSIPKPRRDSR